MTILPFCRADILRKTAHTLMPVISLRKMTHAVIYDFGHLQARRFTSLQVESIGIS